MAPYSFGLGAKPGRTKRQTGSSFPPSFQLEPLERRVLLSGDVLLPSLLSLLQYQFDTSGSQGGTAVVSSDGPTVVLGPSDGLALDQPRVLFGMEAPDNLGELVGPLFNNIALLDTGANGVLLGAQAYIALTDDFELVNLPDLYEVEINNGEPVVHDELGVAGTSPLDVLVPYHVNYSGYVEASADDGSTPQVHVVESLRALGGPNIDMGGFAAIIGMPAMAGRVVTMDLSSMLSEFFAIDVRFSDTLPATPANSLTVDLVMLPPAPEMGQRDPTDPLPTFAPLPLIENIITTHNGVSATSTVLLDSGAQLSIISTDTALAMGIDPEVDALDYLEVGGIGGTILAPIVAFDSLTLPTREGVNLVYTDLQVLVIDIPGIGGIFGMDMLTSGYLEAFFDNIFNIFLGLPPTSYGYFMDVTLDFLNVTDTGGSGSMILNINPAVADVSNLPAPPAAPPQVTAVSPLAGTLLALSSFDLDVTFSEEVFGVDASDLVLGGAAAAGASVAAPVNVSGNTWRFAITGLTDGALNVSLAPDAGDIVDGDGNDLSPAPTQWSYSVDLTAPSFNGAVVVDDTGADGTDALTADVTPQIVANFSEAVFGSADLVSVVGPGGAVAASVTGLGSDTLTVSFAAALTEDGLYTVTFAGALTDAAGHALDGGDGLFSFTLDTTPPTVSLAAPVSTTDATPELTVTAADANGLPNGTAVLLDVDLNNDGDFDDLNEAAYATAVLIDGQVTFELSPALALGIYGLRARVTDLAGNQGVSATVVIAIEEEPSPPPDPGPDPAPQDPIYSEDFSDGQADGFTPVAGTWQVVDGWYVAEAPPRGEALTLLDLDSELASTLASLPASLQFDVTLNLDPGAKKQASNGFLIFDYHGPKDYKFAGADLSAGRWIIGEVSGKRQRIVAKARADIAPHTSYALSLTLNGTVAALAVDGDTKLMFNFRDSLTDGQLGLGTKGSVARFGAVSVTPLTSSLATDSYASLLQDLLSRRRVHARLKLVDLGL